MKGEIIIKVLELLEDGAMNSADFLNAILVSGYGASMSKIEYEYQKCRRISTSQKLHSKELMLKRERLQKFLSKLKRDGLIKEISGKYSQFSISSSGKAKLAKLKSDFPKRYYEKEIHSCPVIISFDIPEKLRRKRDWFREVIKNLGFRMVHQSVWIGKIKIPKQLIFDLETMNILEYIEIFEISKTGSLKKIGES